VKKREQKTGKPHQTTLEKKKKKEGTMRLGKHIGPAKTQSLDIRDPKNTNGGREKEKGKIKKGLFKAGRLRPIRLHLTFVLLRSTWFSPRGKACLAHLGLTSPPGRDTVNRAITTSSPTTGERSISSSQRKGGLGKNVGQCWGEVSKRPISDLGLLNG